MTRLWQVLSIRPGEGRPASLVIGVMLATSTGAALGSTLRGTREFSHCRARLDVRRIAGGGRSTAGQTGEQGQRQEYDQSLRALRLEPW